MESFLKKGIAHVVVWLAVVALTVYLFNQRNASVEWLGLAQCQIFEVAPLYEGVLERLEVKLYDKVRKGQVLAVLNDDLYEAQIQGIAGEAERLEAELKEKRNILEADIANRNSEWIAEYRAFKADEVMQRTRLLEIKALQESDKILMLDLQRDWETMKEMQQKDSVSLYDVQKAEALYLSLKEKVQGNEIFLQQLEIDVQQARQRCEEYKNHMPVLPSEDLALEHIEKAIAGQEKLMQELIVMKEAMVIQSPCDGTVIPITGNQNETILQRPGEALFRQPGETLMAGDPILAIAEEQVNTVVVYAADLHIDHLERQQVNLQIVKKNTPYQTTEAQTFRISPTMEVIPEQLRTDPTLLEWGRPILIQIPDSFELASGELVNVKSISQ